MKKFKFNLSSVLELRKSKENESLKNLADARSLYQLEIEKRAEFLKNLEASFLRRESTAHEPVGISAFVCEQNFIDGLKQRIIQCDHAIFKAEKNVNKYLKLYIFAKSKTRMMETLRDKALSDFKSHLSKKEENDAQDLMIMRARMNIGDE